MTTTRTLAALFTYTVIGTGILTVAALMFAHPLHDAWAWICRDRSCNAADLFAPLPITVPVRDGEAYRDTVLLARMEFTPLVDHEAEGWFA